MGVPLEEMDTVFGEGQFASYSLTSSCRILIFLTPDKGEETDDDEESETTSLVRGRATGPSSYNSPSSSRRQSPEGGQQSYSNEPIGSKLQGWMDSLLGRTSSRPRSRDAYQPVDRREDGEA